MGDKSPKSKDKKHKQDAVSKDQKQQAAASKQAPAAPTTAKKSK
jgi:hypothetical protein